MKTILRLTCRRTQIALTAALLAGCSLNVIIVAVHVAQSTLGAQADLSVRSRSGLVVPQQVAGPGNPVVVPAVPPEATAADRPS
jgi:hypothetical protein